MKIIKTLLSALVALIVVIIVIGLFLPTSYTVERSIVIDAPPEQIHKYVSDLDNWGSWEPWSEGDPSMVVTRGGKTKGIGASQSWVGKDSNSSGALTFTKDSPTEGIEYDIFFDDGTYMCKSAMKYSPLEDGETKVTWTMTGDMAMPVVGGYFVLMMDSTVGEMFDKGLANLKNTVENQP